MELTKRKKETVRVTFSKDYNPSQKPGGVIYKEDEVHLMNQSLADKIKSRGASIEVEKIDWEKETEEARKEFEEAEKEAAKQ